jgi:multiple sugar transport system permease protein
MTAQVAAASHRQRKDTLHSIAFYLVILIAAVPTLFIFYWMAATSIKQGVDQTAFPPKFLFTPTLHNYIVGFTKARFVDFTINSTIVALGSTALALVVGLPAAYSIARFRQTQLSYFIIVLRMAPGIIYLIPWFMVFSRLKLVDTFPVLIATHAVASLPIIVWTMISFFEDLPAEIEEAARIDGCNILGSFARVALPLSAPGVVATAILGVIFSWNNFLWSLILAGHRTRTLPLALFNFMSDEGLDYGGLASAAVLVTVPVLLLTLFIQRYIVAGLAMGGVKG